jgi:hypothetical protein
MSDCLHCDIHDLLEAPLQREDANLTEIAAKVTEVLADLILLAPAEERGMFMADILANLGEFVLQKAEETPGQTVPGEAKPRRH